MSVAGQLLLNQVVLNGGGVGRYSGNFGSMIKFPSLGWFEKKIGDPYNRTNHRAFFDKIFGVSEHQLHVRYGMIDHVVVPRVVERDWVDDFESWVDEKFVPYLNGRITITPQKVV